MLSRCKGCRKRSIVKEDEFVNALKPLVVLAILGGIGYGVYHRLNGKPESTPPGAPKEWDAPKVQLGDEGGPAKLGIGGAPALSGIAPAFGPNTSAAGNSRLDNAPAFTAPEYNGSPPGGHDPHQAAGDPLRPPGLTASPGGFAAALEAAKRELDSGRLREAHLQLSQWYDDPRLSASEQQQLSDLLSQVSGTVIYSTQHVLEQPYEVQPGERLEDIANRYGVPAQLLAKINGLERPEDLRPGERLKVVRGPFSAVVSLEKRMLTLLLNGAYAGRFPIAIGHDQIAQEGNFTITDKVASPVYRRDGRTIGAGDPSNPLGKYWLSVGTGMGIHGTNDPRNLDPGNRADLSGCIALGERDCEDVFDILSIGSTVTIRR